MFLLGLLTKRRSNRANVASMTASVALMLIPLLLSEKGILPISWSWIVVWGTFLTFAGAIVLAPLLDASTD